MATTTHLIIARCCTLWFLDVTLPYRRCPDCKKTPVTVALWRT